MPFKDPEERRAYQREYKRRHYSEAQRRARNKWNALHPERMKAYRKRYRDAHPEVTRAHNDRRIRVGGLYIGVSGMTPKQRQQFIEDMNNGKAE